MAYTWFDIKELLPNYLTSQADCHHLNQITSIKNTFDLHLLIIENKKLWLSIKNVRSIMIHTDDNRFRAYDQNVLTYWSPVGTSQLATTNSR